MVTTFFSLNHQIHKYLAINEGSTTEQLVEGLIKNFPFLREEMILRSYESNFDPELVREIREEYVAHKKRVEELTLNLKNKEQL